MEIASSHSGYVDLHIHSTASDGSLTPAEIIQVAKEIGLKAIAITDHDTVDGSAEALSYPQSSSLEILPGLEISVDFPSGSIHILGYMMRLDDLSLTQALKRVQEGRRNRNLKIVEKLQALDVDIRYEEIREVSGGGQVGRPHIAQVLVQKKAARSVDEAFRKYLKRSGPAYVPRYRLSPAEAIRIISGAGGIPVLAHPFTVNAKSESEFESFVLDLKQAGLKGLEVYYPEQGYERTARYEKLARRHGLLMTGGTDFHGAAKPGFQMGSGKGDFRVPYRVVQALKASSRLH
jgi:predicted metal-dependent phosphoesterase TrpH